MNPDDAQAAAMPTDATAVNTAQRTKIKICGLTREQDVDAVVACGADAIGFVLYPPSPRYVNVERAAALASRLPPLVTPVLLFVNEPPASVAQICQQIPGAVIQFHGDETPQQCTQAAKLAARPYWRAARIPTNAQTQPAFDLVKFAQDYSTAQAILLDAHVEGYGGGGKSFNWSQLSPNVPAHLVLSGGLNAANVIDGILKLRGLLAPGKTLTVDVSSGVQAEAADGSQLKRNKDPLKIQQFVAAVRAADEQFTKQHHVYF